MLLNFCSFLPCWLNYAAGKNKYRHPKTIATCNSTSHAGVLSKFAWDSVNIHDKLLGQWDWEYIQCFWDPEKRQLQRFLGMTVEFKSGDTLEIK